MTGATVPTFDCRKGEVNTACHDKITKKTPRQKSNKLSVKW